MAAIHQIVAGFTKGDAITHAARVLRERFCAWGCAGGIWSEPACIHPDLRGEARPLPERPGGITEADTVLLHLSIGSPLNDRFAELPGRKAILYHNITPPAYFETLQPRTAALLRRGREQLAALAGAAEVNLAVSAFNAREMKAAGYREVRVLPLPLDFGKLAAPPDRAMDEALHDGRTNILFVGRCAPNKRIDDLLRAFACFRSAVDPTARLVVAGATQGNATYYRIVRFVARDLGIEDQVLFTGGLPLRALLACYRAADLFLCMSEHEGFCAPLLESMHFDVPVLAYAAGAVPETLDGAGVLFREKEFRAVAEMMGRLARDGEPREAVLAAQRRRLERFRPEDALEALRPQLTGAENPLP